MNSQNGFSNSVQVSFSGLPTGVISYPASPFTVAAGSSVPVLIGVTAQASAGNFTINAQGSSGSLSHSASLSLTIQSSLAASLPRTTYVRTYSTFAADTPPAEAHHRHIAYDPANHHLFVANRAMNRVEVFSTTDQMRVAQIDVPGASSADLSADGTTVWIGTIIEQIVAVDTTSLEVKARYSIAPYAPVPNATYDRPEEVVALANGTCIVRLRESSGPNAILALWNPTTSAITSDSAIEQYGLGVLARTGDHNKALLATNDSNNDLAVLDASGNVVAGPISLGAGSTPIAAANPDGSRFAVLSTSNGASQLFLVDASLNRVNAVPSNATGLTFSRDGNFLYVSGSSTVLPAIQVYDGHSLQSLGQLPDASIQGVQSAIEDADETQLLFAIANRGVSFLDAACVAASSGCTANLLPATVPSFAQAPVAQPSEGPAVGGTSVSLSGQNFESTAQVTFAGQLASGTSVANATLLQAASPPSAVAGAANVTAYFPSGWLALAPDAFSYGPQILEVLPNAGAKVGGDSVQVLGYGFGADASKVTVTIGGANATVQKVENISSIASSLGFDSTYPFSLERITLQTPSGTAGDTSIAVTSPAGSGAAANAFQYLQSMQTYANPGLYKFLLYDQHRQFIYLSATDHVDVFDLNAGAFKPGGLPLYCPSRSLAGPCPDADVRGLALTPDGSQLVVADWGSQNIFLLDPESPGTIVPVPVNILGYGPARVAATSTQTIFVALSAVSATAGPCAACLAQLDLTASPPTVVTAPQPEVSTLSGTPLLQTDATGDRVVLAFNAASGGPIALWNAAKPDDFTTFAANESPTDVAVSGDGTMFAAVSNGTTEVRDASLALMSTRSMPEREQIPTSALVPGLALDPTGALIYQPFLTGPAPPESPNPTATPGLRGGIDILDSHSGRLRLRIFLPEPIAANDIDTDSLHAEFLTTDETGQRIFVITKSGLTVVQLASAPLAIGTRSPANGPAAGGTSITMRGSGFQSGTTATLGGKNVNVTFKDQNTLTLTTPVLTAGPQQLVLTNPGGETTTLDAAFVAN